MPVLIGLGVALAVAAFARITGLDRDRAFYPVVLIVVAHYYLLFAAMGGSSQGLVLELVPFTLFVVAAAAGYRTSLWIVVTGLALHGLFDLTRQMILPGSGVPTWWPGFCLGFDLAAAAIVAGILLSRSMAAARG